MQLKCIQILWREIFDTIKQKNEKERGGYGTLQFMQNIKTAFVYDSVDWIFTWGLNYGSEGLGRADEALKVIWMKDWRIWRVLREIFEINL